MHVKSGMRGMSMIVRPPVAAMLCLFCALGMAAAGENAFASLSTSAAFLAIVLYLVNGAALNDIHDAGIDRVNVDVAPHRALAAGVLTATQMKAIAWLSAAAAVAAGFVIEPRAAALMLIALVLNAAYSVPPVRICERGAVAAVLLPIFFTGTPYLMGVLAAHGHLGSGGWLLLAGIYIAYIGRGLLKDFRDVQGDVLYGKRTFVIRHGRTATCVVSGVALTAGNAVLALAFVTPYTAIPLTLCLIGALRGLRLLARSRDLNTDNILVEGIGKMGSVAALSVLSWLLLGPGAPVVKEILAQAALGAYGVTCLVLTAQRAAGAAVNSVADAA